MQNAFTVDVEDYFQVQSFERVVPRSTWEDYPSRVVASTQRILDLLDRHQVTGTFFVLGWVAERFPTLVRQIQQAGHEIGSHSYWHRRIDRMTPEEFHQDLRKSLEVLSQITGEPVRCYRAPSFSVTPRSVWALEILQSEGIEVDSSIYPIYHDVYGFPGSPRFPYLVSGHRQQLIEFPPSTLKLTGVNWPVAGGGYLRLFPFAWTSRALSTLNRKGKPGMLYIHPWEVDPEQPRIAGVTWKSRLRHYVNLKTTERKLDRLLSTHRFGSMKTTLEAYRDTHSLDREVNLAGLTAASGQPAVVNAVS